MGKFKKWIYIKKCSAILVDEKICKLMEKIDIKDIDNNEILLNKIK